MYNFFNDKYITCYFVTYKTKRKKCPKTFKYGPNDIDNNIRYTCSSLSLKEVRRMPLVIIIIIFFFYAKRNIQHSTYCTKNHLSLL